MANDLGTDLDQLLLESGQRPRLYFRPAIRVTKSLITKWFRDDSRAAGQVAGSNSGYENRLVSITDQWAKIELWSLTHLKKTLIKIGPEVVSDGRYVAFQMAEVSVARQMVADILS